MSETSPAKSVEVLLNEIIRDGPYTHGAFAFVQKGLGYTVRQVHGNPTGDEFENRHISGQQLCVGLRDYAIHKYGLLARNVLEHWNIHRTDDFGRIVFSMIDAGLMSCRDDDAIEDFYSVYIFDEEFDGERILGYLGSN